MGEEKGERTESCVRKKGTENIQFCVCASVYDSVGAVTNDEDIKNVRGLRLFLWKSDGICFYEVIFAKSYCILSLSVVSNIFNFSVSFF